ncbi:helix-turn-helix domain-containing protein [Bacillus infantis]|uniref:helix-turn-helix domain-containing protein n=1 Tax=Bacillus infantis TaxID=324767 RepID=UPI003CE7CB03
MLGKKLKCLRIKNGYSLNALAKKAGISKSYLSYIERDVQMNPSLQILSKLAAALEVRLDELIEIEANAKNQELETAADPEWIEIVHEAIEQGISKEDFSYYLDFLKYNREQKKRQ